MRMPSLGVCVHCCVFHLACMKCGDNNFIYFVGETEKKEEGEEANPDMCVGDERRDDTRK